MANLFYWKVHAVFDVLGIQMRSIATGPAENIYTALGAAKSCFALNFPKLDTGTIFIDFVEADGNAGEEEIRKGWDLIRVDEV